VHAPDIYKQIATDECSLGAGCWHPDAQSLGHFRHHIVKKSEQWIAVRDNKSFSEHWKLFGESLSRPPRVYDVNHPAIVDLKRKDFVGIAPLTLAKLAEDQFPRAAPFMKLLCDALELKF